MATLAQEYAAKLDALAQQAQALPAEASKAVLDQLRDAGREVRLALSSADPASYTSSRLQAIKSEITRVMQSFSKSASTDVAKIERRMYQGAVQSVDATVGTAYGGVIVHPVIDTHTIAVAQGYTADLISGLSSETATRINGSLQRAVMGQSTLTQLIAQIGGELEGGTFSGLFGPAGSHASLIATNEVGRMHSVASDARINTLAKTHKGLQREWWHIPAAKVPRPSHVLASGQTRDPGEPFLVGGEELMYPRDPNGSADNTIGCHCLLRPKVPEALLKPSDREREFLKSLGLSVTTSR